MLISSLFNCTTHENVQTTKGNGIPVLLVYFTLGAHSAVLAVQAKRRVPRTVAAEESLPLPSGPRSPSDKFTQSSELWGVIIHSKSLRN